jgi:hypothetical protein
MFIKEVTNQYLEKDFIEVAVLLNKHNPYHIRPIDADINDIFRADKNKNFQYGLAARWVLYTDNKEPIGRIAAFTHKNYVNKGTEFKTGCMGFFECINDQAAANELINCSVEWLKLQGMEAVDGPINFGDRDKWWGLMVEGFDLEPIYGMPLNPPYYQDLLENYGLQNYYNQYWYRANLMVELPQKIRDRHARFANKPDYSARHVDINSIEKYAGDFATVYNAAWAQHGEKKETTKDEIIKLFKTMKPVMDVSTIWFGYYKEEPICMFINIPDINQYTKNFNGKFGLLQKLQFVWKRKFNPSRKLIGLAFGVVPKYQALGVDSFVIQECSLWLRKQNLYADYEMGWAADWNPIMHNIYKSLGANQSRRMVTYRYIFDNKYPFERHPVMEYK